MGGKSGSSAPPPPDPMATANAQAAANRDAVKASYQYGSIDQYAPWGSTTYQKDGEGVPTSQTVTLGQPEQKYYNTATGIATNLAGKADNLVNFIPTDKLTFDGQPKWQSTLDTNGLPTLSNPNLTTSLDTSGLPSVTGSGDFSADRDKISKTLYDQQYALMQPDLQQQEERLNQQLADRGLTEGSEAWNRERDRFQKQRDMTLSNLASQATLAGGQEQSRLFGLDSSARAQLLGERATTANFGNQAAQQKLANEQGIRQQGISEDQLSDQANNAARVQGINELMALRSQPFNEASALIQGAPAMSSPQFINTPSYGVQPAPVASSIYNSYSGAVQANAYNNQQKQQSADSTMSTIGSIAGIAAMAFM